MAEVPGDLKFADTHEWARVETDGTITVGISDHAQDSLGDVVFVELPEVDMDVEVKGEAGVVESVKAASDIYAPVSGTIIAVNEVLEDAPETVNESPYENGWFFKMKPNDLGEMENLMSPDDYQTFCENEADH